MVRPTEAPRDRFRLTYTLDFRVEEGPVRRSRWRKNRDPRGLRGNRPEADHELFDGKTTEQRGGDGLA